jgi:hypothetical protein
MDHKALYPLRSLHRWDVAVVKIAFASDKRVKGG